MVFTYSCDILSFAEINQLPVGHKKLQENVKVQKIIQHIGKVSPILDYSFNAIL